MLVSRGIKKMCNTNFSDEKVYFEIIKKCTVSMEEGFYHSLRDTVSVFKAMPTGQEAVGWVYTQLLQHLIDFMLCCIASIVLVKGGASYYLLLLIILLFSLSLAFVYPLLQILSLLFNVIFLISQFFKFIIMFFLFCFFSYFRFLPYGFVPDLSNFQLNLI